MLFVSGFKKNCGLPFCIIRMDYRKETKLSFTNSDFLFIIPMPLQLYARETSKISVPLFKFYGKKRRIFENSLNYFYS